MFFSYLNLNKNHFLLNKKLNLVFLKNINFFFLNLKNFSNGFFMPSFFFFSKFKFKFFSKFKFKSFLSHFKTGYSKLFFFFFFKFKLRGLGYRAKFVTNIFFEFL